MSVRTLVGLCVFLLVPASGWAQDGALEKALLIEKHVNAGDLDGLVNACGDLAALLDAEPTNQLRYASAFCHYRLATMRSSNGMSDGLGEMLAAAQEHLQQVVDATEVGSPDYVEALSLQAGVMGFRIGIQPGLAMSLGSRSSRLISKVARMAPDNPRVQLQVGVSKYNTPKMFGGSMKKAEQALRKAVSLFAETAATEAASGEQHWPNWGYLDALAWLGQALAEQDKTDEARAAYQQALAINPDMAWVKYVLLPALEKKAGAG